MDQRWQGHRARNRLWSGCGPRRNHPPAAGFVTTTSAIIFGIIAGPICYFAVSLKEKLGYDDSLDVVSIHGEPVYASDHGSFVDLTDGSADVVKAVPKL